MILYDFHFEQIYQWDCFQASAGSSTSVNHFTRSDPFRRWGHLVLPSSVRLFSANKLSLCIFIGLVLSGWVVKFLSYTGPINSCMSTSYLQRHWLNLWQCCKNFIKVFSCFRSVCWNELIFGLNHYHDELYCDNCV